MTDVWMLETPLTAAVVGIIEVTGGTDVRILAAEETALLQR